MRKITDNIYIESESSVCNTGIVVTDEGLAVIDTPMVPAGAKKLAADIARFGPVRYVINTEPHPDHIAGNCYFGGTTVAHDGVRGLMVAAKVDDITRVFQFIAPDSLPLDDGFRFRPPEITFSEECTLYLGQLTLRLMHVPGHTPYSLAVYIPEERIVFTSDNVNLEMPVFGDSLPDKWLETLEKCSELDVDTVVPGHGAVCDKSCFSQMSATVHSWTDAVADAIKKGLSFEQTLEEMTGSEIAAQMPKEGGADFLRLNVEKLYKVLSQDHS